MAAVVVGRSCRCQMKRLSRNVLLKNSQGCEAIVFNAAHRNNDENNMKSLTTYESQRTFSTFSASDSLFSRPNSSKLLNRSICKDSGSCSQIDSSNLFKTLISLDKEIPSHLKMKFIQIGQKLFPPGNLSLTEVKQLCSELTPDEMYDLGGRIYSFKVHIGDEAITVALPVLQLAANEGHLNSKYTCGHLLLVGTPGTPPDPVEAVKLFTELAEADHGHGQFALARMYYSGTGSVEQNFKHAFSLYKSSTLNGVPQGYNSVGKLYMHGQGVDKDESKALKCFIKGAEAGDPSACTNAAHCYNNGKGVGVDYKKAFQFNSKAAELNDPLGMFNVGAHYLSGMGVEVDYGKAFEYFEKSATNGFSHAKIDLGNMYYEGLGVEKDWNKAKQLYEDAASAHVPEAKEYLKGLEEVMNKQKGR